MVTWSGVIADMTAFFADLHIHIGRAADNKPVKITAARDLTFENIARECAERKGMDLVGIIDCAAPAVLRQIRELLDNGAMVEVDGGGIRYRDAVTLILAAEMETRERDGGMSHHLCYFRDYDTMQAFSDTLSRFVTNRDLSSQFCHMSAKDLLKMTLDFGGFLVPAHAFTPHKSVYGSCARRLSDLFGELCDEVFCVELGLSADSDLADRIAELHDRTFLTNSDAHSLPKIGREYNVIRMNTPTFDELQMALKREGGRGVVANYGLDPRLGKYHRTFCDTCQRVEESPPPVGVCPQCGSTDVTKGVLDRIVEIQDFEETRHPPHRPPYYYQVPLQFVPKVGAVTLNKLLNRFGTEMNVLHRASREDLEQVVGRDIAASILAAREGKATLTAGGGGRYGKMVGTEKEKQMSLF
ncbi:MAG: endonuclease Q family protein [Abditibacteriales bacterium]|nr:endonuclease Q family protein [Abditibacteriales bacterium]